MTDYLVIYERDQDGWSAYAPDLPGCVAAGASRSDVERLMRSALEMHLEALRESGQPIPPASTVAGSVAVG